MMRNRITAVLAAVLLSVPTMLSAQMVRSSEFNKKYTLKEVVVLSRHNIRAPLCDGNSILGQATTHQWHPWSAATGELTTRGGVVETMMGQYFRKWIASTGLIGENQTPTADDVLFYANSMQRTIATAQYFAAGFMPVQGIRIFHRFAPSKMDPVFRPQITRLAPKYEKETLAQIAAAWGGTSLTRANKMLADSYSTISRVLDLEHSPAYKAGTVRTLADDNCSVSLKVGEEPIMHGSLLNAAIISDALTLQYYEQPDNRKAAFGHDLNEADWEKIARVKDTYQQILFGSKAVAVNTAHPLLVYINDELHADCRKFTFLCGHDSNIASVTTALDVEPYELPEAIEKQTPIGCKLVFEKWTDAEGKLFVAVNIAYPATRQLRQLAPIDADNRPMVQPLRLKGMTPNADGLYAWTDIEGRFQQAIRAYDDIR